jgi:ribose transport system permease protein
MSSIDDSKTTTESGSRISRMRSRGGSTLTNSWIVLVLIGLVVLFSILNGNFFSVFNLTSILVNASVLAIMAVGQTYVIITAGIDLSVGSVLVFSGVTAVVTMRALGGSSAGWGVVVLGIVVALVSGVFWGLLNGFLIARSRVPALIVTLGTLGMALGIAEIITGGVDISTVPTVLVNSIGFGQVLGVPVLVIIAIVVIVLGQLVLKLTKFGRHTYAIGSNPEAARRATIPVRSQLIKVYALQGLLAGLAGILSLARFSTTTLTGHSSDNLAVISGVVLAGTSLFGGYGSVLGTAVGILIPVVLQDGLVIIGLPSFWQTVLIGAILIAAVYLDQVKRRSRALG